MKTDLVKDHVDAGEACRFLAEYAAWLYGCGATCTRITKNVNRMATHWGLTIEMTVLPGSIHLSQIDDANGRSQVYIRRTPHTGISFYKNTKLSTLSWSVADGKLSFDEVEAEFRQIIAAPFTNKWAVLFLTSVANLSFCGIFGGDWWAMAVVFVATMLGYRLKQVLLEEHVNVNIVFMLCAFFSAVVGTAGYVFHLGSTPEVAVGTSVLYLVPGIVYINSVSDMLFGQYLVAFSRFMNATVLTFCLATGLAGGILIMNLEMF